MSEKSVGSLDVPIRRSFLYLMIFVTKPRIKSLKFWRTTRLQVKLTVNKVAKDFTVKKFSEWFSRQISIGLENGQELQDIEIDYRLSVLKPLHATWLISVYD